jgi:hypothetical protein
MGQITIIVEAHERKFPSGAIILFTSSRLVCGPWNTVSGRDMRTIGPLTIAACVLERTENTTKAVEIIMSLFK